MLVWNHNSEFESLAGFGIREATIEYSVDGVEWQALGQTHEFNRAPGMAGYASDTAVDFDGVVAKYVKITALSNWGGQWQQYGLSEVCFLYMPMVAREPRPASGTTGVTPQISLAWRAGREAVVHDVYLGTDPNGLVLATTVAEPSYEASLDLNKTYYWRIDEINAAQDPAVWQGTVWTLSTQPYLLIDDFEGYTNNSPKRVFQTWIDGLGFSADTFFPQGGTGNGSGAMVGKDPSQGDIMERTIFHLGAQSMPVFYDNSTVAYSEATRTFEGARNWAVNGIKSLSLYFAGAPGNSGKLYVKINNTKVLYDGDAADIARELWQPWNIDLSVVGAGLSSVATLSIGIEGAGAKGTLYIDDIRLYPRLPELVIPAQPQATNLVARYAFDGNANDSSGNAFNGQERGGPTYGAGVAGQAMIFDGVDDYVDIGNPPTWPAGKAPRSMSMWAMTYRVGTGYRLTAAYGTGGAGKVMCMGQNGTTLVGAGWGSEVALPRFWQVDAWHHICLTYDGTTARLYADGIQVAAGAMNWNLALSQARIGCQVGGGAFWNGVIDDLCIYGRVLSAEEIAGMAGRQAPTHRP